MASLNSNRITALIEKVRSALTRIYQDTPFSAIQERSPRQPGTKGPFWIRRASFLAPEPEESAIRYLVDSVIRLLGRGDEQYTIPTISDAKAERMTPSA